MDAQIASFQKYLKGDFKKNGFTGLTWIGIFKKLVSKGYIGFNLALT
jgi:hypothetical protein